MKLSESDLLTIKWLRILLKYIFRTDLFMALGLMRNLREKLKNIFQKSGNLW